ncbi:MAG: PilZ domain-containing protein [Pseudomonadota bacterium]
MNTVEEINKRVKDLPVKLQEVLLKIILSWQTGKKRDYKRFSTPTEIDILVGDRVLQTNMKNISASGVFIKTPKMIDVKKDVRVVFSLPGSERPFKLEGVVVRSTPDGLAVEFKKVTSYFKCILDEAICREFANKAVEYSK